MEDTRRLEKVYDLIEKSRRKYGKLKKCEIHFHTPASHDYRVIESSIDREYNEIEISEIIQLGVNEQYISQDAADKIIATIDEYNSEDYLQQLAKEGMPYESFKEFFTYSLIAHKLYKSRIEVAVVTDHNTIKGFPKLKFALDLYFKERLKGKTQKRVCLFLGVEISCSEKNHLVAIFDEKKYVEVQKFLDEYIINEVDGTYYTSHLISERIANELDGISYLAHINSSKLLGSDGYNKTLFARKDMKVIGITTLSTKTSVIQRLYKYNKEKANKIGFIYESDSHAITTLGEKNTWIKFSEISFAALKNAINNHKISIYTEKPNKVDKFIKGLVVESGRSGFLKAQEGDSNDLCIVEFSKDLNCIIGGRGTGKSTILNLIEIILTLQSDDIKKLKFVSSHRKIYLVFCCAQNDYIAEFIPQVQNETNYNGDFFLEKAFENEDELELSKQWLNLYKVGPQRKFTKLNDKETQEALQKIYRRGYSINGLVSKIDSGQISDFIKDTILYGVNYTSIQDFIKTINSKSSRSKLPFLRNNLYQMLKETEQRRQVVESKISDFNIKNDKVLKIVYSPKQKETSYYLNGILRPLSGNQRVANTYLSWDDVARYVHLMCNKISYLEFLFFLLKGDYQELQKHIKIELFINEIDITTREVERHLNYIDNTNISNVFEQIRNGVTLYPERLISSLEKYFEIIDEFSLEFNVNSRELLENPKIIMKPITDLSLGQKVVALLTFVFQFGHHVNDNTPLIIDQPEDNLDNQYIYKNLVSSLRTIKNSRQVIIVTHSSTIVTNADAEQIIVMNSNSDHGWVERTGYPSDLIILKHVLNNLEGGIDSFKHKAETYSNLQQNKI